MIPRHVPSNNRPLSSKIKEGLLVATKLFGSGLVALWIVDVLLNLNLFEVPFIDGLTAVDGQDFVGLFQAEAPVALFCAIFSIGVGALIAFLRKSRRPYVEAIILMSGALCALTVTSATNIALDFSTEKFPLAAFIGMIAGLFLLIALRRVSSKRLSREAGVGTTLFYVLFPALVSGFAIVTLTKLLRDGAGHARLAFVWALVVVALAFYAMRSRSVAARWFTVSLAIGAALLVASVTWLSSSLFRLNPEGKAAPLGDSRPHIILIVLDTVRADHLKRYGYARNTMPALERWANDAMTGKRVVSPAGWTTPAHVSILSGRPVSLHGVHYGHDPITFKTPPFQGIEWLPSQVAKEGYLCLGITANSLAIPPEVTGFRHLLCPRRDRWKSATIAALVEWYGDLRNPISEALRWRVPYADARQITDLAIRAVPESDRPVFLFMNFLDAHSPYNPPRSALKLLGVPTNHRLQKYLPHRELTLRWDSLPSNTGEVLCDHYDGELRWIDLNLERLLSWIDQRFGEEAIVIITSDHGEELGEEGRVGHEYGLSQRLIHVPLFIRSPQLPKGELEDIANLRNLYEFIRQSARGEKPGTPVLTHVDEYGIVAERYASGSHSKTLGPEYDRPWVALIEGRFKGVGPSNHEFQLFDIEKSGFNGEFPVSQGSFGDTLRARIDQYWVRHRDSRGESDADREKQLERLRSLGYID